MRGSIAEPMSPEAEVDRNIWLATLQATLIAATAMVLVAWLVWLTVPAKWVARGFPSQIGYGKNVEHTGLIAGSLLAIALALICLRRPLRWRWIAPSLLCGFGIVVHYGRPETVWAVPLMLGVLAVFFAWFQRLHKPAVAAEPLASEPPGEPWPRWCSAVAWLVLAMVYVTPTLWPYFLDGFHQGEVILTALDWMKGGAPYETVFWPHGLHDTWLTAKVMEATDNHGLGAVMLSRSMTHLLGLMTLQVTAVCLLRRWADAVLLTAIVSLLVPDQVYQLGVVGPAILPLAILARRTNVMTCLVVGGLLAWAFLWRFEGGVFGLAAALAYVGLVEFYAGYATGASLGVVLLDRQRWQVAMARIAALLLGVAACFVITRVIMGVPTWSMLRLILLELPRYHADNTGFPLPLPLERFDAFLGQENIWMRWFTPAYLLFAVLLVATLVRLLALRRYSLATLTDRFFLVFGLYVLLQSKTMLDRADLGHVRFPLLLLGQLILFDVLARLAVNKSPARVRLAWSSVATLVCFGIVLPQGASPGQNGLLDSVGRLKLTCYMVGHPRTTLQHLRFLVTPTTKWQDLLEPSIYPQKFEFLDGVREARSILQLEQVGDRKLAIVHSGPILYPLLGVEPATRYYMLGWAMNDAMERQAVADMETNNLRALLRVSGLGGTLPNYDIPDEFRVPIIDGFLKERSAAWPVFHTRLGALHVDPAAGKDYWSLESTGGQWSVRDAEKTYPLQPGSLQGCIDLFGPEGDGDGMALAGWAASVAEGGAAHRVLVMRGDQVVVSFVPFKERPDVASALAQPGMQNCGFHLKIPRRLWDSVPPGEIRVLALSATSAAEIALPGGVATLASQPATVTTIK